MPRRTPDPPEQLAALAPGAPLDEVAAAAQGCRNCPLYRDATATVFGQGPAPAPLMLVGEQPGDQEDRQGHPFVGPAGKLLDRALADAGIDRSATYVTNAVKHFKWRPGPPSGGSTRGSTRSTKVRIHQTPSAGEVAACRPWLTAELERVEPRVLVLMGATAAKALLGPDFRVTQSRGQWLEGVTLGGVPGGADGAAVATGTRTEAHVTATIHPSAVLRSKDRDALYASLVNDLSFAASAL